MDNAQSCIRRAVDMSGKHPTRSVYVWRDRTGRIHITLTLRQAQGIVLFAASSGHVYDAAPEACIQSLLFDDRDVGRSYITTVKET